MNFRGASFMDKVSPEPNSGCWLWTASLDSRGYGQLTLNGKLFRAHRVSYQMHKGPIPDGLHVCHACDVPSCCNPDHLFLGTNLENIQDRCKKGRTPAGEKHWMSKLTSQQVAEIRAKLADGRTQKSVAQEYGMSQSHISDIHRRKLWK